MSSADEEENVIPFGMEPLETLCLADLRATDPVTSTTGEEDMAPSPAGVCHGGDGQRHVCDGVTD